MKLYLMLAMLFAFVLPTSFATAMQDTVCQVDCDCGDCDCGEDCECEDCDCCKPKAMAPDTCYETSDGGEFCLRDHLGKTQVLIYNAGWCGPCNYKMKDMVTLAYRLQGKAVFASLSGEGQRRGSRPDQAFLKRWKAVHSIPFTVAGKYRDFGKAMGGTGTIPFTVVLDKNGRVAEKGNLTASDIEYTVKKLN